ncbi:MAG: glycosyltransferase family 2 protein [Bacteroidaceae bacterium]|nr:glycosyltransferase family 2 protein [Bacteroidaceae bacterium]
MVEISVIIPSYKPDTYIFECLESLRMQTLSPQLIEVIVVLNGCNDPYFAELKVYEEEIKGKLKLRLFQIDKGGVSNARNFAMQLAHGRFITFIDDDDNVSPTYLEEMYKVALTGAIPASNIIAFSEGANNGQPYFISDAYQRVKGKGAQPIMQVRSYMSVVYCKLIPKELLEDRFFDTRFTNGEDCLFMTMMSDRIKSLTPTGETAIYYRRLRAGSAVTRKMSFKERAWNSIILSLAYIWLFVKHPFSYNPIFFATRVIASLRGMVKQYDTYQEYYIL